MFQKLFKKIGKYQSNTILKSINVYHTQPERVIGTLSAEESVSLNNLRVVNTCSIGFLSYFGSGCEIRYTSIGRYCSIGKNVTIGLYNHPINRLTTHPLSFGGSIQFIDNHIYDQLKQQSKRYQSSSVSTEVGHDVWIGHNATIKSGVTVNTGAVVGACSVVTKDVPAYAIVAGNPARIVKYRFDEKTREKLLSLQWWKYDLRSMDSCDYREITRFIEEISQLQRNKLLTMSRNTIKFDKKRKKLIKLD